MEDITELRTEMLTNRVQTMLIPIPEGATNFEAYNTPNGFKIKFVKVEECK